MYFLTCYEYGMTLSPYKACNTVEDSRVARRRQNVKPL